MGGVAFSGAWSEASHGFRLSDQNTALAYPANNLERALLNDQSFGDWVKVYGLVIFASHYRDGADINHFCERHSPLRYVVKERTPRFIFFVLRLSLCVFKDNGGVRVKQVSSLLWYRRLL